MKNNVIKLNENQLHQIVAESVKKVLKESAFQYEADDMINRGYEGIKNRMDIQEILDWLDEHYYDLTPSQKDDFKQLWDMAM